MLQNTVFAATNGVLSMTEVMVGSRLGLAVGGGDGSITVFVGSGKDFVDYSRRFVDGAVRSLCAGTLFLCGFAHSYVRVQHRPLSTLAMCMLSMVFCAIEAVVALQIYCTSSVVLQPMLDCQRGHTATPCCDMGQTLTVLYCCWARCTETSGACQWAAPQLQLESQ